jgi:cytidine deaminase
VANVAAVVLTADGETFAGVNVGNDVGGICAEVAALACALAVFTSRPELVAATRLDGVVTPCGRSRRRAVPRGWPRG